MAEQAPLPAASDDDGALTLAAGTTRAAAIAELRRRFGAAGIDTPALDARVLAAAALGVEPAALIAHPEATLDGTAAARLRDHGRRRLLREPVSRILGTAEFWGLPFRLSPGTLVPRPDTEALVSAALALLPDSGAALRLLDLGTGSGCILVALLHERPAATGLGIDRDLSALATARENAEVNGVGPRACFALSEWDEAVAGRFDLVVSNPPYIPKAEIAQLDPEVSRHDPEAALDGGQDGLDSVRVVLRAAARLLAPDGHAVVEFGHDQADLVAALAREDGLNPVEIVRDMAGHQRAVVMRCS